VLQDIRLVGGLRIVHHGPLQTVLLRAGQVHPHPFRQAQILPSTFEYSLNHLIDHEPDRYLFHARVRNDENRDTSYDPLILLKIVFYACSLAIVSSRKIALAFQENVIAT
jgi:hypothetical protein